MIDFICNALVGKILWWDKRDNEGQIRTADGRVYYFDSSVVKISRGSYLRANLIVTFEPNTRIKDCLCAKSVSASDQKTRRTLEKEKINKKRKYE